MQGVCECHSAWFTPLMLSEIYRMWPTKLHIRSPISMFVAKGDVKWMAAGMGGYSQVHMLCTMVPMQQKTHYMGGKDETTRHFINALVNLSALIKISSKRPSEQLNLLKWNNVVVI